MKFRHLPPTAAPLTLADLRRGLAAAPDAPERFATDFAAYLGGGACFPASSGRAALWGLLRALKGRRPSRQEVIIPAYTCPALVRVTQDAGLRPRLVDISPETLRFDEAGLAAAVGQQTLAVIIVHPFGIPQPLDAVMELARAAGALVIEDAAQAMGARLDGPVGTGGDFGLFSLGPGKPLSTGGGGILAVNDPAWETAVARSWTALERPAGVGSAVALARLAALALAFHPAGWWLAARLGAQRAGDSEAGQRYRTSRLTAAAAAVGRSLLPRLEAINRRRRDNAARLIAGLDGGHVPTAAPGSEPIYLRLPVLVRDETQRERLLAQLSAMGIGAGRMYGRPLSATFPALAGHFPGAEQVARRLLTLPTHHYLTDADIARILSAAFAD